GRIYVSVEGDKLKGQVSLPLDVFKVSMLRGRYLNGEADLKASLQEGVLIVTLDSIEVNGQTLPEEILTNLRQQNLAKDAYKNPKNAELIRKLESLEIKDGKIILKVRAKPAEKTEPPPAKKAIPVEVVPSTPPEPPTTGAAPGESAKPKVPAPPAEAPSPKS